MDTYSPNELSAKVMECEAVLWNEFFEPSTELLYDYRTTLAHNTRFDHLPTVEEIAARIPNPCGWSTGMEDSVINGGLLLATLCTQYDVTHDDTVKTHAQAIFRGLERCGTISGVRGFVARSISPRDGKSFYPESSRDQYTHFIAGLYEYFMSPISSEVERGRIIDLLSSVAEHLETVVSPENDYTIPRADNQFPRSGVCKMWNVGAHEAARLPMAYAAAYAITKDRHWYELFQKYAEPAVEMSLELLPQKYLAYALLQMQTSLKLIYEVAGEPSLKEKTAEAMRLTAYYAEIAAFEATHTDYRNKEPVFPKNWRELREALILPGCRHVIPKQSEEFSRWHFTKRDPGEAFWCQLAVPGGQIHLTQLRLYERMLARFEPEAYSVCHAFVNFPSAYWLARKKGVIPSPVLQNPSESEQCNTTSNSTGCP